MEYRDYYEIMGLQREATQDEIKRAYRKLARKYHPDVSEEAQAEEKFKEVAEAYGVLTDRVKREQYDSWLKMGGPHSQNQDGFSYSQEEILKDLFSDPRFQQLFQGLLKEFQRSGFRASPNFIRKSFFGGKGGMVFGGLFLFFPLKRFYLYVF